MDTPSLLSKREERAGLLWPFETVADLLGSVPYCPLGDLDAEVAGLWKAYVTKRERERKTSAVMLHLTKLMNASMKAGNVSRENVSALSAFKNFRTIPIRCQCCASNEHMMTTYSFGIVVWS